MQHANCDNCDCLTGDLVDFEAYPVYECEFKYKPLLSENSLYGKDKWKKVKLTAQIDTNSYPNPARAFRMSFSEENLNYS